MTPKRARKVSQGRWFDEQNSGCSRMDLTRIPQNGGVSLCTSIPRRNRLEGRRSYGADRQFSSRWSTAKNSNKTLTEIDPPTRNLLQKWRERIRGREFWRKNVPGGSAEADRGINFPGSAPES